MENVENISPGVKALNKVQFQLEPGEVHALMGENGAGKSTFIKVITGVHKAEEGEMFLNGQKVNFCAVHYGNLIRLILTSGKKCTKIFRDGADASSLFKL